jgi:hypothetical protein
MDLYLIILGAAFLLIGLAGSLLPGLPGPPAGYAGLLLAHFSSYAQFSITFLIIWAVVVIVAAIVDYVVPVWGTKKFGGTRAGIRGSTIGLLISVLVLPMLGIVLGPFGLLGILGGPFVGAWMGEKFSGRTNQQALRAALGSFIGFVAGTLMKIALSITLAGYFIMGIVKS